MKKGNNKKTFAYFEEIPHLKVDEHSSPAYIYKRLDTEINKEVEHKSFHVGIPVPKSRNGKRLSLKTTSRDKALQLAAEKVIDIRTQLAQGLKIKFTTAEQLTIAFLKYKKSFVRGEWQGKVDAGDRSITKARFKLIEGKIRNYFLPFVGASSNAHNLSYKKFDKEWEIWRKDNPSGVGQKRKKPKNITIQNEMTMIREIWNWGQMNGFIQPSERKPFDYVNLVPDEDKIGRHTWEAHEWSQFKDDMANWFIKQTQIFVDDPYKCFEAQVTMILTNILGETGLRTGEAFKLKWKDIKFFDNKENHGSPFHKTGVYIQVHASSKTGAREVNSDAGHGFFILRETYREHASIPCNQDDFVFRHLDGKTMTTRWYGNQFKKIREDLKLKEKTGKHLVAYGLRHYYCTSRIYAGVSYEVIADNMVIDSKTLKKSYKHSILRKQQKELFKPVYLDEPSSPIPSDKEEVPLGDITVEEIVKTFEKGLNQ